MGLTPYEPANASPPRSTASTNGPPLTPPSQEGITSIRRLIGRINGDLDKASDAERTAITEAVNVMRRRRAISLGMPAICATPPNTNPEATP